MMRKVLAAATVALAVLGAASVALADGIAPRPTKKQAAAAQAEKVAAPAAFGQTGDIAVPGGAIRLFVPANYYFLSGAEARAHLQRIGAPMPAGDVVGMVAPANTRPIDDNFVGAVISTNPLGHVAEERTERLTAPDFLEETRAARPSTAPRLDGFAVPPTYDRSRRLASWTERVAGPASARTMRSEQRLLGRNTVAGVTIDGRADQQAAISATASDVARMISFPAGQTYADFAPASDTAPLYDLPSLVTLKPKPTSTTVVAASTPEPAPAPGSPAKGIPAKSKGLQPVETAGEAPASAPAFAAADLQQWLPWIGGGLIALAVIPWLVGLARRGRDGPVDGEPRPVRSGNILRRRRDPPPADPNLTPSE
jgi:uncharacterized membrane-anchored protein